MRKKLTALTIFLLFILFTTPSLVLASAFNLKSIGNLSTDGQLPNQWWYTSLQPTFTGEAAASSSVDITIDSSTSQTAADASGNWSFTPAALAAGDHTVALTSDGSTISFTLTLGSNNVDWDAASSGSGTTLPTVGFFWPTIFLLLTGLPLILFSNQLNKN